MAAQTRKIPFLLFILAQAVAGCAAILIWFGLRWNLPDDSGSWPVGIGIVFTAVLTLAIFLSGAKREHFLRLFALEQLSFRNIALCLAAFLPAALVGLVARNLIPYLPNRLNLSPAAPTSLFFFCIFLPFLAFDLTLLAGDVICNNGFHRYLSGAAHPFQKLFRFWDNHPTLISLVVTLAFMAAFLFLFHIGYETNDDVFVAAVNSGYFGGTGWPFPAINNVLLGLLLELLYKLPTRLNWEILFFSALNFLSVWALLQQAFSRLRQPAFRLIGALVILSCDAYFLIKINFTSTAAFAALAGFCILFLGFQTGSPPRKWTLVSGGALLLAASLIRMQSVLLVLLVIAPALVVTYRSFRLRQSLVSVLIIGLVIGGGYAFDKLYVRASSLWYPYSLYYQARIQLQDTPRLANLADTYPEVGWSENDYQLFEHWFLADPQVYSLQNLQTLVADTTPRRATLNGTLSLFSDSLFRLLALPYLFLMAAVWLAMLSCNASIRKSLHPSLLVAVTCLGVIAYLITVMKIPNRVLFSILSAGVIFGCILFFASVPEQTDGLSPEERPIRWPWLGVNSLLLAVLMALGLVLGQTVITSRENMKRQVAYQRILLDLAALQQEGALQPDALIVSAALGVPLEWANPLVLDFPSVQYLSMGWLTFSPPYETALQKSGVASLPAGFYQNDNVYLMETPARMESIRQFILEHEGLHVNATVLYDMPSTPGEPVYAGVQLYKLELKR